MKYRVYSAAILIFTIGLSAYARPIKRKPAQIYPVDMASEAPAQKGSFYGFGILGQFYYDPLTSNNRMLSSTAITSFGNSSASGVYGLQILATYLLPSKIELGIGFDYMIPINQQGQQGFTGSYAVNSQNLNVMGIRLAQVGYQMVLGSFTIVPYAAFGIDYGKDVAEVTNVNQVDTVTFSKLMMNFAAGARADWNLNGTYALNIGLELSQPVDVETQLSQSGSTTGEFPGYESNLQNGMNFMTSTGVRIYAGVKATF